MDTEVERRDDSCDVDMLLDGDLGEPNDILSAHVPLVFIIIMINHGCPFPSSFRAGVKKEQ